MAGGRFGQEPGHIAGQPGQDHLGLGIAEAHIELEHLGPVRGEHQSGVEHAAIVDPPGPQGHHQWGHRLGHQPVDRLVVQPGDRGVGAHAAGVGTPVEVVATLEVLGRGQRNQPLAVAQHEE